MSGGSTTPSFARLHSEAAFAYIGSPERPKGGKTMGVPKVDPDLCTGCGICEDICPDVFEIGDDGLSHVIDPNACEDSSCCEEAVDECPEGAITIE
jgi:ferredoxin